MSVDWLDTRDMDWGSFPGLSSGQCKVIHAAADGAPLVFLVWLPPGDLGVPVPHRHYHATTYENSYIMEGDLPHAEWASADSDEHEIVVFRKGYFMDRKPGSLHGLDEIYSETGNVILFWRNRTGNWLHEPAAAEETIDVPFVGGFAGKTVTDALEARWNDGVVLERDNLSILDTREMPWEEGEDGMKLRTLARDDDGAPKVRMVHLPPGEPAAILPPATGEGNRYVMVLEGELPVREGDETVVLRAGYAARRAPGTPDPEPAGPAPVGAVLIEFHIPGEVE